MLIKSKFFTPKIKAEWIFRDHLPLLDAHQIRETNLTVIHAPAGYGKSTFAAQQLQQSELRYIWLTLDTHDNHPARFWRYFIAAFQKLVPGVGDYAQQKLREGQFSGIDDIVGSLVNDLMEREVSGSGLLVLDDFHLIEDPDIVSGFQHCVRYLPDAFHVLVISRSDVNVSRQQYSQRAVRIFSFSDLKLSHEQTRLILCKRFDETLSERVVEAVFKLTDGWVVGVQLLCMQLDSQDRLLTHIDSLSSCTSRLPEQVVDYFIREVFNDLEVWEQSCLLRLGLLPKVSFNLCQQILGEEIDCESLLQRLESSSFLVAAEGRQTELRFHDLFRGVLLELAQQKLSADEITQLQQQVVHCLKVYDGLESAFYYAIEIQQWYEACACLQPMLLRYRRQGDFLRVAECVERLPNDHIESDLNILSHYCWSLANLGRFQVLPVYLDKGAQIVEHMHSKLPLGQWQPEDKELVIEFMTTVSLSRRLSGYLGHTYSQALSDFARQIGYPKLSKVHLERGMDAFLLGELDRAALLFMQSIDCAVKDKEPYALVVSASFLYLTAMQTGQLNLAIEKLQQLQQWLSVAHVHQHEFISAAVIDLCLAGLNHERGQPIDQSKLQKHIALLNGPQANHHMKWLVLNFHFNFCIKGTNFSDASKALLKLVDLDRSAPFRIRMGAPSLEALAAELAMLTDDQLTVSRWVRTQKDSQFETLEFRQIPDCLLLARAYYYLGMYERAYYLAERVSEQSMQHQRNAQSLMATGIVLASCMALGWHSDMRVFISEKSERVLQLLERTQFRRYIDELVSAYPRLLSIPELAQLQVITAINTDGGAVKTAAKFVPEPLSFREQEVLQAAAQGLSNTDIADRLCISVNTVKTHLKKIYGKIEVSSRTQALHKARHLGWLEEAD